MKCSLILALLCAFSAYSYAQNTSAMKSTSIQSTVSIVDTASLGNSSSQNKPSPVGSEPAAMAAPKMSTSKPAVFAGDMNKFITDNLIYPPDAKSAGITGDVKVKCEVNDMGKLHSCKIAKSVHPKLDSEALRLARKMPNWTPAIADGQVLTGTPVEIVIHFDPEK